MVSGFSVNLSLFSPARLRLAKSRKSCKFIPPAAVIGILMRQQIIYKIYKISAA